MSVADDVYTKAVASLRSCCLPLGLKASGRRVGHQQVWARDSMIALLGGCLVDDEEIRAALVVSLTTLRSKMSLSGCIPNNVDPISGKPNFRAYADAGLWWVIGSSLVAPDPDTCGRVLAWYDCQDVDQSGLLSMQESTAWQDLFCTRGKGLYLNCLYVLALECAAKLGGIDSQQYIQRAAAVRKNLNEYHWYRGDGNMRRHIAHTFSTETKQEQDSLGRKRFLPEKRLLISEQYYLSYLGFRAVGEWFDSLGHLLALLGGVATEQQAERIFAMIDRYDLARFPIRALFPPVTQGDPDWRDYYGLLNLPDHYHNGGVWPFIGGFYVAALVRSGQFVKAEDVLVRLAELNAAGDFNEWHHGATGEPMGVRDQAWSSGMYIYAYECVRRRVPIHFDTV